MARLVDYYVSLISPWTYLGHARAVAIADRHEVTLRIAPIDVGGVFAATGGLPLAKRSPQRQAYRMAELRRWRRHLDLPLNLEPKYFPADESLAAGMVYALRESGGDALGFGGALMRAVWVEERDIASRDTLLELAAAQGVDGESAFAAAQAGRHVDLRAAETKAAIVRGVFGVPTYAYGDQLLWGQDRLDFLDRLLAE